MTDTKKTDTKEKPSAGIEIAKNKISSQELPEQKQSELLKPPLKSRKKKGF